MEPSDIISIAGIAIQAAIGIYIATSIQNRFAKSRCIREHFIQELSAIQVEYRSFINLIWTNKSNSRSVKDKLKNFSERIKGLENILDETFELDKSSIVAAHSKFQQELTMEDEFNVQYTKDILELSEVIKTKLYPLYNDISNSITKRIIEINKAKLK